MLRWWDVSKGVYYVGYLTERGYEVVFEEGVIRGMLGALTRDPNTECHRWQV